MSLRHWAVGAGGVATFTGSEGGAGGVETITGCERGAGVNPL